MFEHVTAQRVVRVYEEARLFEQRREPTQWAAHRGRLLWVTFLAKTRKVTGCRATPGGFDLNPCGAMPVGYCPTLAVLLSPFNTFIIFTVEIKMASGTFFVPTHCY